MHNQSITIKLDSPEFFVSETITDKKNDLLVIVASKGLPPCPNCGALEVSLHDRRKQLIEDQPVRD